MTLDPSGCAAKQVWLLLALVNPEALEDNKLTAALLFRSQTPKDVLVDVMVTYGWKTVRGGTAKVAPEARRS